MTGIELIAQERTRQITEEGYDSAHDDRHWFGELAWAATCYAAPKPIFIKKNSCETQITFQDPWPWDNVHDEKPCLEKANYPIKSETAIQNRIRDLTKAGALIAAEIDRLLRISVIYQNA